MVDHEKASQLARAGFDSWQEGRLEESAAKYREALLYVDPNHVALDLLHGQFAAVLATLGRDAEAREQYELALAQSLRQDPSGTEPSVSIARYFLAEHLLKIDEPAEALGAVEAGSERSAEQTWFLRLVEAKALWKLGRQRESRVVGLDAIERAPTEQARNGIREQIGFILAQP